MTRVARDWFEQLYAGDRDPWGFESRWYERRKYALTLAALPSERYRRGFEPGCSTGVLTARLAERCDELLAADQVATVVADAARRLRDQPHVRVEQRQVPEEWPDGPFDLIVLSEMAYYFDAAELEGLVSATEATLEPGGVLVGVHWRGATDYPLSGDETHRRLGSGGPWSPVVHYEEESFLLDVWRRT